MNYVDKGLGSDMMESWADYVHTVLLQFVGVGQTKGDAM